MIARIIFIALILFGSFRFLSFAHKTLKYRKSIKHHMSYIIPIFELLLWIGYALWCINYIYQSGNYKGLVLLGLLFLLIAIPSFFLLRDFVFGVYLKIQRKIDKGDFIEIDEFEGEILEAGHFNVEIKDKQGDINSIPYNRIRSKIIAKHGANPNLKKQTIIFKFPDHNKVNKLISELKKNLLNTPWVAVSQPPFIENIKQEEGMHVIEVAVFTLKNEYAQNIKEIVERDILLQN
jgi:small-conductance mechanosensitive channel